MSRRVRRIAAVVAVAALLGATTASAAGADVSPATIKTTEQARKLVERFLDLLSPPDEAGLRKFLSSAFVIQRANGTSVRKAEFLENPSVVESYEIQDLEATRTGPVIVARYDLVADVTIDGQQQSTDPAPRLSVFVKGDKGWQIVAHANFNVPA